VQIETGFAGMVDQDTRQGMPSSLVCRAGDTFFAGDFNELLGGRPVFDFIDPGHVEFLCKQLIIIHQLIRCLRPPTAADLGRLVDAVGKIDEFPGALCRVGRMRHRPNDVVGRGDDAHVLQAAKP
jgi:hypothetical protein